MKPERRSWCVVVLDASRGGSVRHPLPCSVLAACPSEVRSDTRSRLRAELSISLERSGMRTKKKQLAPVVLAVFIALPATVLAPMA